MTAAEDRSFGIDKMVLVEPVGWKPITPVRLVRDFLSEKPEMWYNQLLPELEPEFVLRNITALQQVKRDLGFAWYCMTRCPIIVELANVRVVELVEQSLEREAATLLDFVIGLRSRLSGDKALEALGILGSQDNISVYGVDNAHSVFNNSVANARLAHARITGVDQKLPELVRYY